ncbi:MAG: cytochrome c3 family protein [Hyphomicrobiaceae bacterium]|nr:cytochrome c3 family protein [Hyphomicrobiaceae bacterium]
MARNARLWLIWIVATAAACIVLVAGMIYGGAPRAHLLIGKTTSGHHQIELSCESCHTKAFAGPESIQAACLGCHQEELKQAKDSHPAKKFTDPRNADRLEKLAATRCITCHTEHKPEITRAMGVTLPSDYCALCHQDIGKDRPSHKSLSFATCADAGCHNYHDNRALYEDFLEKHANEPEIAAMPIVRLKAEPPVTPRDSQPIVEASRADHPASLAIDESISSDWLATSHAKAGVNCSGCHAPAAKTAGEIAVAWTEKPDHTACSSCHAAEASTFTEGRHGMRLAKDMKSERAGLFGITSDKPLTPMRPELSRLPMSAASHGKSLTCNTCHSAHRFDVSKAETAACLGCHDEQHSRSYRGSPHHKLHEKELAGAAPKGSGVTCATCHLPRETREDPETYEERLLVSHNQNANLRPNEKMIRSVCMNCHGLGFSIDSLADPALVRSNFTGRPSARVESIQWVMKRLKDREGRPATSQANE